MIGNAWIFGNFPGEAGPSEQKAKDIDGKEWILEWPEVLDFNSSKMLVAPEMEFY